MPVVYPPEHTLPIQHHPITEASYPHLQLNRQIIIHRIQHVSKTNSCIQGTTIKKTAATFGDSATNSFMMPNTTHHYYKTSSQTWILKPYSHAQYDTSANKVTVATITYRLKQSCKTLGATTHSRHLAIFCEPAKSQLI